MAKKRNLWPDIITDRRRRKTSMESMCLYYDLLMCCDDQGIFPLDIDKIILEVCPYFRREDDDIRKMVDQLEEVGFIESYIPDGYSEKYLKIIDWHQQGVLQNEFNKYPNQDGTIKEGKRRLGGRERSLLIKSLAEQADYICESCNTKISQPSGDKISDVFTLKEIVNAKSRGSKYAENYTLICKRCHALEKPTGDTQVTQCVTTSSAQVTQTRLKDKGLRIKDKGLRIKDKDLNNTLSVDNFEATASMAEQYHFLSKVPERYWFDIVAIIEHWSECMGISVNLNQNSQINKQRAAVLHQRLKEGYGLDDLKELVSVASKDDFVMGKNERNTPYNSINHLFRDKSFEMHLNRVKRGASSSGKSFMDEVFGDLLTSEIDITPMEALSKGLHLKH